MAVLKPSLCSRTTGVVNGWRVHTQSTSLHERLGDPVRAAMIGAHMAIDNQVLQLVGLGCDPASGNAVGVRARLLPLGRSLPTCGAGSSPPVPGGGQVKGPSRRMALRCSELLMPNNATATGVTYALKSLKSVSETDIEPSRHIEKPLFEPHRKRHQQDLLRTSRPPQRVAEPSQACLCSPRAALPRA